jgi:predicted phage terminase large subunit-like protein
MNDADLIEALAIEECQESFWAFRQFMNPKMKKGWFQRDVALHLQIFYEDFIAGKRPMLVIEAPPQHGKSDIVVDFLAWIAGKNPDLKTIYASFSKRLGVRANKKLQRIFDSGKYKKVFPRTAIDEKSTTVVKGKKQRSSELLEYFNSAGSFRNTTTGGSITGESLDIGVIDDPIKGRKQAGSELQRDTAWDWLIDDFMTRFSDIAALLAILTRWHLDDPIGRLITTFPGLVKVLKYPAMATSNVKLIESDPRVPGSNEPLFPEHKSFEFLEMRRKAMATSSWESLYQQNPIQVGGEIIKGQWFPRYRVLPPIKYRMIFADTAMKIKQHNDYSVFSCWGLGEDGKLYLLDQIRGKWEAPELRQKAIAFWLKHLAVVGQGALRKMGVEDKASGTGLIQDIQRSVTPKIPVKAIERNIDKLTRVMDVVSYIEAGYVIIPEFADFVSDFIKECEAFTADDSHAHDDQIDPMCDAINNMIAKKSKGFFS